MNMAKCLRAANLKNTCEGLLRNDGNILSGTKSWKPPIIAQYDAPPRRIKRSIVLSFLKVPLIVLKNSFYYPEYFHWP